MSNQQTIKLTKIGLIRIYQVMRSTVYFVYQDYTVVFSKTAKNTFVLSGVQYHSINNHTINYQPFNYVLQDEFGSYILSRTIYFNEETMDEPFKLWYKTKPIF